MDLQLTRRYLFDGAQDPSTTARPDASTSSAVNATARPDASRGSAVNATARPEPVEGFRALFRAVVEGFRALFLAVLCAKHNPLNI